MFFDNKIFLLFLILIPLLAFLAYIGFEIKARRLSKFASPKLLLDLVPQDTREKQILKLILKLLALFFFVIALAGPKFGTKIVEVKRKGLDVIIALDTSLSMLAEDVKPNRISQAKVQLARISEALAENRIGIIAFAGDSFLQCPLTLDINAIKLFLGFIDVGTIPLQGTNMSNAIELAINTFDKKERKYKVLIFLTDGEDHDSEPLRAAEEAKREGIKIFTIGFGSKSGELIPVRDEAGKLVDYKRDQSGQTVSSKLDEELLKKIADITGGKYYYSKTGFLNTDAIVSDINFLEKKELNSKLTQQYEHRFYYFLLIGILLLIADFFVKETGEEHA